MKMFRIFNCSIETTSLGALSAAAVLSVHSPVTAMAQESELEEIVVYGTGIEETIPLDLSRYGNRVEVITAEEIRQRGFVDVTQTLQMLVPGLHIRPKNGQFDYFDASLQGSRNAEILWTIDGVRITNRLYNGTSPLDTIPVHMVERIEVLKGGQGIFYGTQSVSGVVNIVTRSFQDDPDGAIGAGLNSNDGYGINAWYRAGSGSHQFVGYASRDQADGYQPWRDEDIQPSATDRNRSYDVNMIGLKYAYDINDNSRLSIQYQYTGNELDFARAFLNYETVNARDEDILTLKYDWQATDNFGLFIKAYSHTWDTEYTRIYNTLDDSGAVTGTLRTVNDGSYWGYDDYGLNAMAKLSVGGGLETVFGLDHQNFSGADDVWRIGDLEEQVNAAFAQVRTTPQMMENTTLALGVRLNEPSNSDSSTVWNISGKHDFTDNFYFRANFGTSFRLPDAEALFLNEYYDDDNDGVPDGGWFAIGNPNLGPEESRNVNLAIGGTAGNLGYELIGFTRKIISYIDSYVPLTIAGVVGESFINSDDQVEVDGFEFIATAGFNESWRARFAYSGTSSELNGDGIQLTGIPETEIKLGVDYGSESLPFGASLSVNVVGDINARRGQVRGDYSVVDFSAFYYVGSEQENQLVFRIENLTDEVYASRVDRGTLDVAGVSYLYDHLGMRRTVHAGYTRRF
ncbi:MAG: TonB-dependent receptor [Rhodospirillaceae bacterium]|nr:TonB-dependent receptor [Rhodospirillaceae bacterium]